MKNQKALSEHQKGRLLNAMEARKIRYSPRLDRPDGCRGDHRFDSNAGSTTNLQVNRTGLTLTNLSNSFYVGSVNAINTPLPITLISFTAALQNEIVKLAWETAAEINNDHFTAQRSEDSKNWLDIKTIKDLIDNNTDSYYTVSVENPLFGISYYRLKQTDVAGRESFSDVRTIDVHKDDIIQIYPNPATDYVTITSPWPEKFTIVFLNSFGQKINVPIKINGNTATVSLSGI